MSRFHAIALLAALTAASGCTDNEQFRVNGTVEGSTNTNFFVVCRANGEYKTDLIGVREGKFEFFVSSEQPTIVEIYDHNFVPQVRLYARNGETFDVSLNTTEPLRSKISGNDVTSRWCNFLRDNAATLARGGREANALIADYIGSHPDDVVSTLLFVTQYDLSRNVAEADSLLSLIRPEARPSALTDGINYILRRMVTSSATGPLGSIRYSDNKDSSRVLNPRQAQANIIAFDRGGPYRNDSTVPVLDRLSRRYKKGVNILEIDLEPYGTTVRNQSSDTCRWALGRVPGGLASTALDSLGIPSEPYFIVTDSLGRQVYRGPHVATAAATVTTLMQ